MIELAICSILLLAVGLLIGPRIANAATASTTASVTSSLPVASSAVLNGGTAIILTTNTTTSVVGTVTVTDDNGCEAITGVTSTLFRTNVSGGSGATNDNQTHYSATCVANADCTGGGGDLTRTYNCTFSMVHYADPTDAGSLNADTDWTFNATPSDGSTGTSSSTTRELNTLAALGLETTSMAFGTIALGANTTTTNKNISVANLGNEGLDVGLTGYGTTSGDNLSMTCTVGTAAINKLEYGAAGFTYGVGTALTNISTTLDLDLDRSSDSTHSTKTVQFGFGLPASGVSGSCTGTVVITAVSDPTLG